MTFGAPSPSLPPASSSLSRPDRTKVLRFAASFLWADLELEESERRFLAELARELEVDDAGREIARLIAGPPTPEDVDPAGVPSDMADVVRHAALRAIAADGRVGDDEMHMFELLDDLLPRGEPTARRRRVLARVPQLFELPGPRPDEGPPSGSSSRHLERRGARPRRPE